MVAVDQGPMQNGGRGHRGVMGKDPFFFHVSVTPTLPQGKRLSMKRSLPYGDFMKTVLVFGTFDGLHPGHEYLFREARKLGDRLIALVARDATVERVKSRRPDRNEETRRREVEHQLDVDEAVFGHPSDFMAFFDTIRPDVICLGYDQEFNVDLLSATIRKRGLAVSVVRLHPFHPDRYKSSLLRA